MASAAAAAGAGAACCAGKCGCGSSCKCGTSCGGCKMNPDITSEVTANTTTLFGLAPTKGGSEMGGTTSEHDGCKCGDKCTCDPCTCK